ncbi:MAG TPA: MFS transporter [Polyangia bacterium]|nr:MFS transporter [Polyangia bacterium]
MKLSPTQALYLQASIPLTFLAGSSAPTPLYATYQAAWGFSPVTVTVIFGIYAVAVLASLLVVGSLSDHVGRRPVLIAAALTQAATMIIFTSAGGVRDLILARVVQGLATGAAAGAAGAGMLDIDRAKGTIANAVGPMLGTATGGLLSGLLVQFLPAPTKLVYVVLGVLFVAQTVGAWAMTETAPRRPGALASLRPHVRLPRAAWGPMLVATPVLVASWALAGFFGSLGPALVRRLVGATTTSPALGGAMLFVFAGTGALTVLLSRLRPARSVMLGGSAALIVGVAMVLVAVAQSSLVLFFAGMTIMGTGFGAGFQGALRTVVPLAQPHERAGVLSLVYVVAYLAMGVPAVVAGLRVVHGGGLVTTAREYGFVVMALAALAIVGMGIGKARAAMASSSRAREALRAVHRRAQRGAA